MITTVDNNNIDGLAEVVSVQQISKYFPECPDCVHANLAQKSHPKQSDRVYEIGKTLAIDVFEPGSEKINTEKRKKKSVSVLTHTGERYAVICKDRGSDRTWIFLTCDWNISNEWTEFIVSRIIFWRKFRSTLNFTRLK